MVAVANFTQSQLELPQDFVSYGTELHQEYGVQITSEEFRARIAPEYQSNIDLYNTYHKSINPNFDSQEYHEANPEMSENEFFLYVNMANLSKVLKDAYVDNPEKMTSEEKELNGAPSWIYNVTKDYALGDYYIYKERSFSDFNIGSNPLELMVVDDITQYDKAKILTLPKGPWLVKNFNGLSGMKCASCGCGCYASQSLHINGGKIFIHITSSREDVLPNNNRGVYYLDNNSWVQMLHDNGSLESFFVDESGCRLTYEYEEGFYSMNLCEANLM